MDRGDIYLIDLDPVQAREQRGRRPVLVVTKRAFNTHNPAWVCPIATAAMGTRLAGLTVSLVTAGTRTTGVVLCNQIRAVDIKARRGKRIERVPTDVLDEVLAVLADILE